jgi:hypothetical protein
MSKRAFKVGDQVVITALGIDGDVISTRKGDKLWYARVRTDLTNLEWRFSELTKIGGKS